MGLSVASLGLLGLTLMYMFFMWRLGLTSADFALNLKEVTGIVVGFSMGASSVALFARVGGGIYTKAAPTSAAFV